MIILSLFVLQVLPAAFCYDIKLEGKLNLANTYLEALRQPSQLVNLIFSYFPEKIVGKGKLPKALEAIGIPYLRSGKDTQEKLEKQITSSSKQTYKPISRLNKFLLYLQNVGSEAIDDISKKILSDLKIKKNVTLIVAIVMDDYKNMLQNYYDYIKKIEYDADRDSLYLDMVQTSTGLLFEGEKKLLSDIIMQENQNYSYHGHFKNMTKELLKRNYLYKMKVMKSLCDGFEVCKEYPAISDYGEEIISEVLMLNDLQFLSILKILSNIFKQNDKILARFTAKEDRRLILEKLQYFIDDLFATKEFFALVRAVITQRFKPITSGSEEFKTKIKATRFLLDILDKALNIEDDVITIDIENTLQAIRNWADHKRDDIEEVLEEFAKNLIVRLEHNMTKNAKKEIKSVITAIMRKNTVDFDRLMKFGSNYLKGNDFHPDIDIMLTD